MTDPIADWLEEFSPNASGVDHLGMRVAGEQAYSSLIDFTTTVSFRPRYFSFLCWAVQKAFAAAGGREGATEHEVNHDLYRHKLKHYDFAIAAATLVADPKAQRIAGSRKIQRRLDESAGTSAIPIAEDHLRARYGSFDIYAGPMYNLRLLRGASGFTRASVIGMPLAAAFERSLQTCASVDALDADWLSLADLGSIGKHCGISLLSEGPQSTETSAEREALRAAIVGDDSLQTTEGVTANRLHSIGVILRVHEIDPAASLDDFRAATLLGGLRTSHGVVQLDLPPRYDRTLAHWRIYQAHAYATLALEGLLSLVIERAFELRATLGEVLPINRVVEGVLEDIEPGRTAAAGAPLLRDKWWDESLAVVVGHLGRTVSAERAAEIAEPELSQSMYGLFDDTRAAAHDACLLFLLACVRMRALFASDGSNAWTGESDPLRLPPVTLVERLDEALRGEAAVREVLRETILNLVIRQHRTIALRKLAADPSRDTSELLLEAGGLIPLSSHYAGTSNPRYDNAVMALSDLGYLSFDGAITVDGKALLDRLARIAAP